MPSKTLSDVPRLVEERKPFRIASMSAENHYPDGYRWRIDKGWNEVIRPEEGVLYVVYSFNTPIAWINQYGQAITADQFFSVRTRRHQGLLWNFKDDAKLTGTKRQRDAVTKAVAKAHAEYYAAEAERKRQQRNQAARDRRRMQREALDRQRMEAAYKEEQRLLLEREAAEAIQSIITGPPEVILLGVEGEREAIDSIVAPRDAHRVTRDAPA